MALYAPTWSWPGVLLFTVDCRWNVLFYCSRLATRNRQLLSRPQPRVLVLSNNSPARQLERLFVSRQISAQSGGAELVNLRVKHDPGHIYPRPHRPDQGPDVAVTLSPHKATLNRI